MRNTVMGRELARQKLYSVEQLVEQSWILSRKNDPRAVEYARQAVALEKVQGRTLGIHRALACIAQEHVISRNISAARKLLTEAELQSINANDWECQAWIHRQLNMLAHEELDWQQSFYHIRRAIDLYAENGKFDAVGHRALGRHYAEAGLFAESLEVLHQVLDATEGYENSIARISAMGNIATVWFEAGNIEKFTEVNEATLALAISINDYSSQALCLQRRGCAGMMGLIESDALADLEAAIEIHESNGETQFLIQGQYNYAAALLQQGQLDRGLKLLHQTTALAKEFKRPKIVIGCHITKSELLLRQQRFEEAYALLKEALLLAEQGDMKGRQAGIHQKSAKVCGHLKLANEALDHTQKFLELQQATAGIHIQRKITAIENRYEMQQSHIKQEVLQLQNRQLSSQVEQLNQELAKMANVLAQRNAAIAAIERQASEQAESNTVELEDKKSSLHSQIQLSLQTEPSWNDFEQLFASVHGDFIQGLSISHPTLTPTELKVCVLLRLNMSSQQVAETLFLSSHTVNTHRQKIRRKLKLVKGQNLVTFLQQTGP